MLLTRERIEALGRTSRFAGWTWRNYSVLEHSVIGARVLADTGESAMVQKAFLLHDLHETEFGGDITSPIKRKYMPAAYHRDVDVWDMNLCLETGTHYMIFCGREVHSMDALMVAAESHTVFTGSWREPLASSIPAQLAMGYIESGKFEGHRAVEAFWRLYDSL